MKRPKLTPEESLQRIKLMMNYDSSRTLLEQTESPWNMAKKTGEVAGGAAAAGGIAGGIAGAATMAGLPAYSAVGVGTALGAGGLATAGAIGGAVLGGAAALALTPLVLWLVDKDQAYPKVKKLFEYVKNNKEKINQVDRGLDDDTIQLLSDDLYNAMKGWGTSNKLMFSVFDSLVTISDLSALIATFNEDHEGEGDGDLLEWLDSDIDISSTWNRIYVPCRNLIKKFAKGLAVENKSKEETQSTVGADDTYKPCAGTYSFGCESESIRKIQGCLGLVEDGKFGPKTQVKLGLLGKGFDKGFTDTDVQTICGLASSLIQRIPKPPTAPTSQLKMSPLAPKTNTTTLPPSPEVA